MLNQQYRCTGCNQKLLATYSDPLKGKRKNLICVLCQSKAKKYSLYKIGGE